MAQPLAACRDCCWSVHHLVESEQSIWLCFQGHLLRREKLVLALQRSCLILRVRIMCISPSCWSSFFSKMGTIMSALTHELRKVTNKEKSPLAMASLVLCVPLCLVVQFFVCLCKDPASPSLALKKLCRTWVWTVSQHDELMFNFLVTPYKSKWMLIHL